MAQNNKTGKAQEPFKPAPGDEAYVHVTLEQPNYDQRTGQRLSRPRMQKFGVREWAKVREQLYKQGYTVEVLYMPSAKPAEAIAEKNPAKPGEGGAGAAGGGSENE